MILAENAVISHFSKREPRFFEKNFFFCAISAKNATVFHVRLA